MCNCHVIINAYYHHHNVLRIIVNCAQCAINSFIKIL